MRFTWDEKKDTVNMRKHKIDFSEACFIFADKYLLTLFDDKHSMEEDRWITMGQTPNGKILVVVHTYRHVEGEELIRLISARKASKREIKKYFERR